jgi:disulfide bond formation protein DsbB
MSQIKNKITLNLILLFSIFALVTAYFVQYILGHKPCNLCLIERLPYIFSIIIISLGLIIAFLNFFMISPKDMIIIEKI